MQIEFLKQRIKDSISISDEIELYNCEDHDLNGNYTVADVDAETGDITLIGTGSKSGYITTICLSKEGA